MIELFNAGLELMIAGMVIVYLFLGMLVLTVNGMSAVLRRYFPEAPAAPPAQRHPLPAPGLDAGIAAAIGAALHRYRATHKP
jgi:oxaloacetate decarboxylase (Na+ extruding) subunit gamma